MLYAIEIPLMSAVDFENGEQVMVRNPVVCLSKIQRKQKQRVMRYLRLCDGGHKSRHVVEKGFDRHAAKLSLTQSQPVRCVERCAILCAK